MGRETGAAEPRVAGGAGAGAGAGGARSGGGGRDAERPWAAFPPELLEAVARAVPAGDRLWFRLVCRGWAAAGAGVAPAAGEEPLPRGKVTRTRGPDAAASVARVAEVMVGAVEWPL